MQQTPILKRIGYDKVRSLAFDSMESPATPEFLRMLGVSVDASDPAIDYLMKKGLAKNKHFVGDEAVPGVTEPSPITAARFIEYWMPTAVEVVTQNRMADNLFGRTVCGARWEDEKVIRAILEYTGRPTAYSDTTNATLADFNQTLEDRTIVRFEEGMLSGKLEDARAAASNLKKSAHDLKRAAVAKGFAISANETAMYGFNNGQNKTYGILNDACLLPYGSATKTWATSSYSELVKMLNTAIAKLRKQTGSNIDPATDEMTLAVASSCVDYLSTANEHGETVEDWLHRKFKKLRVKAVPEFDEAYGGTNVFYLWLERLDGTKTIDQLIVSTMRLLGVEIRAKGLFEDYTNAHAGVMVNQPLGVVRYAGI